MSVTTGGVFPIRTTPMSNITPFTYRDGITYLEILEKLVQYVEKTLPDTIGGETNRIVESFNETITALNTTLAENDTAAAAAYDEFTSAVNAEVDTINNRVGPQNIYRVTLTTATTLTIDPAWPDAHPIMVQVAQDATGGHALTLGAGITGPVDVDLSPNATTVFYLVPYAVNDWHVMQVTLEALKVAEPFITPGQPTEVLNGEKQWTALTKSLVGLDAVDNTADSDKPVSGPLETRFRHRLYSKWDKPLDRWAESLMSMDTAPVVWVNTGSSTANGGVTDRPSQTWFNRVCHMLGQVGGYADLSAITSANVPATGFYGVKAAVGGTSSSNYLSASDVNKINSLSPDVVSHMIGSNDWASETPVETYKSNIRNNILSIRNANPMATQLLIHQQGRLDGTRSIPWKAYGEALRELAEEFPDTCVFLDLDQHFRFMGIPAGNTWGFVVSDNLHLNAAGNLVLADLVCDFMGIPTSKMLGEEVYEATTFTGGTFTTAENNAVIASITIPPKPYIRNLTTAATVYANVTSGHNELLLSPTGGLTPGRAIAARVSNTAPEPVNINGRFLIEPHVTGSIRILASVLTSAELYVTSNSAYASFVAELKPGF